MDRIHGVDGRAVYRLLAGGRIVDFSGRSVAWLDERGNIYDYHGVHRGWYEEGAWVAHDGGVKAFGKNVEGPCPELPQRADDSATPREPLPEPPRPSVYFPPPKPERRARWARRPL